MPNNIKETIETVTQLPWDGVIKLAVVAAIFFYGYGEYKEDSETAGADTVQRDLSVFTLTAIESLRATIEAQEGRQDEKIEVLQEYH